MAGLPMELRRGADAGIHHEQHQELSRHDGTRLNPINPTCMSLIPAVGPINVEQPGSGEVALRPVSDARADIQRRFFGLWHSLKDDYSQGFESLLCQCAGFTGPVSLMRLADGSGISSRIGVDAVDAPAVPPLLKSRFRYLYLEQADYLSMQAEWLGKNLGDLSAGFYDFGPAESYFGRLQIPPEDSPPLMSLVDLALSEVVGRGWACVEILFQPERMGFKNYMRACLALADSSAHLGMSARSRGAALGTDISTVAGLKEKLADNEPVFFAAVRCLVVCEASQFPETVLAVTAPFRSIRYGDSPFRCLTHEDYRKVLGRRFSFFDLLGSGRTLAPGFPVTARELAVLYSGPTKDMLEDDRYPFDRVRGIEYVPKGPVEGVYLGDNIYGKETPVIQDRSLRPLHLAVYGSWGMGKSTFLVNYARAIMEGK